jgi:DNA-binding beta-propeller fold protein YncE
MGTFAVRTNPLGVAFDGGSIWVTNVSSNTVSKRTA